MEKKERKKLQELSHEIEVRMRNYSDSEIRFDNGGRAIYATDGSNYRYVPIGIVIPHTTEAAIEALRVCHHFDVPVLARGGGTALAGQSCNEAVVIDFSKYLNKVLDINPSEKTARVQAGTILDDVRFPAQKQFHLTFGPDPATHSHCTFGGMIGNNSCGIHSVMAGRTADNIRELDILTYDGIRMTVGKTSDEQLESIIAAGGRKGEIYQGMSQIRNRFSDQIRQRYPQIPRRVSGFNLDELLPEKGFHVARALVGTENTCVSVLEATVELVHSPPNRVLLLLGYPTVYEAAAHINEILQFAPVGLEGIDNQLVSFMKRKHLNLDKIGLLPEGQGWLFVELGGEDPGEAQSNAQKVMDALKKEPDTPTMRLFTDEIEMEQIWEIRESGLGATANVPGMPLAWPGWEDSAVHPDHLSQYLKGLRALFDKYNYQASLYGHFGQACVHCRITFDLFTKQGITAYRSFVNEAADLVITYGGSFSGEHGDGQSRGELLPKMYGAELIEAFGQFKHIWDPRGKMNPGKVVNPHEITSGLRLGTSYNPWSPPTHFKFTQDDGSFAKATLRCVGVGKCRRTRNAFMCPSFLVTREEKHTTRGRAHALFEMFRRDLLGKKGWNSKEVLDSLDLCLSCKGCKKECPVDVDIATCKSEFYSHYYRFPRLRPRHAYILGLIGYLAPIGAKVSWLVNFLTQTPLINRVTKFAGGITQKRPFPTLTNRPFTKWYTERPHVKNPSGKELVLFPDVFNNYFYPQTLRAATVVLEHWGYHVTLPQGRVPAVRPLIHYGMLNLAVWELKNILTLLKQQIRDGLPIIFLEPSTAAVFREEMPQLIPLDRDAQRLNQNSLLLSEFIEQEKIKVPVINRKAILHGHCHEKAVLNIDATRSVLHRMGIDFSEPQEGCCGMAGSFGFEAKHYIWSEKIGDLKLIPAIKEANRDILIIADGFSCRTQIHDGTKRTGLHLSEVIAQSLNLTY